MTGNEPTSDFLDEDGFDDDDEFDLEKFSHEFDEGLIQESSDADEVTEVESTEDPEEEYFEVSPSSILEGMLFVGNAENRPLTANEMSGLMRGVKEEEIDELVAQLNESYRSSHSPFEIVAAEEGYRLVLAEEFEFCRQRFYREEKAATLSQTVVDVLALVAYMQPITRKDVEAKRMKPSGSILNQLVRRKLIEVDRRKVEGKSKTYYRTTSRFLELFGLDSLEELPKSQTFESPQ